MMLAASTRQIDKRHLGSPLLPDWELQQFYPLNGQSRAEVTDDKHGHGPTYVPTIMCGAISALANRGPVPMHKALLFLGRENGVRDSGTSNASER